jgi:hypothetical protein
MSDPPVMRALYYPFACPKSTATLKRAVLLFDQVWFMGGAGRPTSRTRSWRTGRKCARNTNFFSSEELAVLVDPEPLVHENHRLLAAAFKADLLNNEVWRLFTSPGTPDTMVLLRRKIPPSAFEFLNSQTYGRIDYGTARAKAFFHKTYMEWPNLRVCPRS